MAAVDPEESPKRQKSPAEKVETSGQRNGASESGGVAPNTDETSSSKPTESPGAEQRANVGIDGGRSASHSGVSVESGAGTDETTCNLPDKQTTAKKTTEVPGEEQRPFDWSETDEDEEEAKTHGQETEKSGMLTCVDVF